MKHHHDSKYSFSFLPVSNHIPLDSDTSTEAEQSYPPPSPRQSQLSGAALNYYTSRLFLDKSYIKSILSDSSEPLPRWAGFACSRARLLSVQAFGETQQHRHPTAVGSTAPAGEATPPGKGTRGNLGQHSLGNIPAVEYWWAVLLWWAVQTVLSH